MQNNIRELRTALSLTQSELAQQLGLNQSAIGKYERGELEPSISTLKKMSLIFDCSIDFIVGHSDDFGNVTVQGTAPQFSAEEIELVRIFKRLPADLQRRATAYMQNLVMLLQEEEQTKKERVIKK